jgi:chromosome segregation ATPase
MKWPWSKKEEETTLDEELERVEEEKTEEEPKILIENLFGDMNRLIFDIYHTSSDLKRKIEEAENYIQTLESSTSEIRNHITNYKKKLEDIREKLDQEIEQQIKGYRSEIDELRAEVNKAIENYKKALEDVHTEVIQPYRVLLKRGEKMKSRLEIIGKEIDNISKNVEKYSKLAQDYAKNPEVVSTILAKYARRATPEEESVWVAELLDEDIEILKTVIKIGREGGYTDHQLMPILAAFALRTCYIRGEPDEQKCKEIGIGGNTIDTYISKLAVRAKDKERDIIITAAYTTLPPSS